MPGKTILVQSTPTQIIGEHLNDLRVTLRNRDAANKVRVGDPDVTATSELEVAAGSEESFEVPGGQRLFAVTEGAGLTALVDADW